MSHWKTAGLVLFAASSVLGAGGSAHAQCNPFDTLCATEWTNGKIINLEALPGFLGSEALGINNAGQAVGVSAPGGFNAATEWSNGSVMNLGALSGYTNSVAYGINGPGQVVGLSFNRIAGGDYVHATEWSRGNVIDLGGLSGFTNSQANAINDSGQAVGYSQVGDNEIATAGDAVGFSVGNGPISCSSWHLI
jgi:probable HAF family extracellular repeat protein